MDNRKKDIVFGILLVFIMSVYIFGAFKVMGQSHTTVGMWELLRRSVFSVCYCLGVMLLMVADRYWIKLVAFLLFMCSGLMLYESIFAYQKWLTIFVAINLFFTTILIDKIKEK